MIVDIIVNNHDDHNHNNSNQNNKHPLPEDVQGADVGAHSRQRLQETSMMRCMA